MSLVRSWRRLLEGGCVYSEGVHMYFGERCTGAGMQHTAAAAASITAFHFRNVSFILFVDVLTGFVFVTKLTKHV